VPVAPDAVPLPLGVTAGGWHDDRGSGRIVSIKTPPKIPFTYHPNFFRIAEDNWRRIHQLKQEHDDLQKQLGRDKNADDDIAHQLAQKNDAIGELAVVVIVLCAFTLEAYIDDYAIHRLSRNYFEKYVDRLGLVAKWVVIPRLVSGQQLDPGSRPLQHIVWLVGVRNKLVHYKSKELALDQIKESDFLWYEDAERAITAVKEAVRVLGSLDPLAETDWL
jgi:hypothetical protein